MKINGGKNYVSEKLVNLSEYRNFKKLEGEIKNMENNAKYEFETFLKKWTIENNRFKNGIDVGCGTSRIDNMIVSLDQNPEYKYAHANFVWDCHDLEIFNDNSLDFIFSSHCLEDFEDIKIVFFNWWKKLKPNGLILLLLPDMEKCDCEHCKGRSRYWTIEDYQKTGQGNPSHKTNVGKKFINSLLQELYEIDKIKYEVLQQDTIPHNSSSSIDFVIKKIK